MLGLVWDVVDAALYFCAQRKARQQRSQRVHVRERCPARDSFNYQCARDAGHIEQHDTGASGVWSWMGEQPKRAWRGCSQSCLPSCSYPKCENP